MLHGEVELHEQSTIQLPRKWSATGCPVLKRWIASSYQAGGTPGLPCSNHLYSSNFFYYLAS